MSPVERELGNLQGRLETVESELAALRSDLREIRDALVAARGGGRMLLFVIGLATSFGAIVDHFLPLFNARR